MKNQTAKQGPVQTKVKLSELCISAENMRKAKTAKKSDNQLKASIKAIGLVQNLVVSQKGKNGYPVEAGGRRYVQCLSLLDDGVFTGDTEISVLILNGQSAKEFSLAENYLRVPTNPVDDFEAFTYMSETEGVSIADIARSFGETQKFVKQRLSLGSVAPELREACRQEKFGLDVLEAFTVSDDHEKQLEAYKKFKGDSHQFSAQNIRVQLTEKALTNDNKLVRYLGLKDYKAAGGTVMTDLFSDVIYINDKTLFDSLIEKKLKDVTANLLKSWSWAEVDFKLADWQVRDYGKISTETKKAPKKLLDSLNKAKKRLDLLDEMEKDNEEWTDELNQEWYDLDDVIEELETEMEAYAVPVKVEMPFAGCLVTVNDKGELVVHSGLVKDEDAEKLESFRNPNKKKPKVSADDKVNVEAAEEPVYSQALRQDLGAYKKSIAKVAIVKNSNLGSDLAMFSLCYQIFKKTWQGNPLDISAKNTAEETSKNDIAASKAQKELDEYLAGVDRSWIVDGHVNSLKAFRALPTKTKKELCAYCAAYSIQGYSLSEEPELAEYLLEESKVESSNYYRPTADNFFKRIKGENFTNLVSELMGQEWLEENNTKKKPYIAERLEWAVAGDAPCGTPLSQEELNKWLPKDF